MSELEAYLCSAYPGRLASMLAKANSLILFGVSEDAAIAQAIAEFLDT